MRLLRKSVNHALLAPSEALKKHRAGSWPSWLLAGEVTSSFGLSVSSLCKMEDKYPPLKRGGEDDGTVLGQPGASMSPVAAVLEEGPSYFRSPSAPHPSVVAISPRMALSLAWGAKDFP